jgi:hypothetical protein
MAEIRVGSHGRDVTASARPTSIGRSRITRPWRRCRAGGAHR